MTGNHSLKKSLEDYICQRSTYYSYIAVKLNGLAPKQVIFRRICPRNRTVFAAEHITNRLSSM